MLRPATTSRLLLGAGGLLLTRRVLPLWGADPHSDRVVGVARILAARHLVQGTLVAGHPTRRTQVASVAVDFLHGLTMVALAAVSRSYRRPAATSACVAFAFAGLTGVQLRRDNGGNGRDHFDPEVGRVIPLRMPPAQPDPPGDRSQGPAAPSGNGGPSLELLQEEAHEHAADLTRRNEALMAAATDAPMRSMSRAGAVVLLLLGVWLVFGQWLLSLPLTSVATTTGTRDEGFAVLVTLAALRLLVHGGRSIAASGVAILCGVLLVCSGVFFEHSATRAAVNEVVCGGVALLCGIAALDRWRAGARAAQKYAVVAGSL